MDNEQCKDCIHRDVCAYKEHYEDVVKFYEKQEKNQVNIHGLSFQFIALSMMYEGVSMKVIDILNRMFIDSNIVIKHVLGIGDSQHYLYKGSVLGLQHNKQFTILDREVHKIYVNDSTLIIIIE